MLKCERHRKDVVYPRLRLRPDSDHGRPRFGARGVGIDIDPVRISEANENAKTRRSRQGEVLNQPLHQ